MNRLGFVLITCWHCGDNEGLLDNCGWYHANSDRQPHPVGEKQGNAWGLYDMHGNVWEWCYDWRRSYSIYSMVDPFGPSAGSYRILRGGSWDNKSTFCRSALRNLLDPGTRDVSIGFRVVLGGSSPRTTRPGGK